MSENEQSSCCIIIDNINKFLLAYPNAEWGPAHIVLSDRNLSDGHIQWCLDLIDAILEPKELDERDRMFLDSVHWYKTHTRIELEKTKTFLLDLLNVPEESREPETVELDNSGIFIQLSQ